MSTNLYIIGNGLDLYFGLPTKTDDFCNELDNEAARFYANCGIDWSSWEEGLKDIDISEVCDQIEQVPDYMSDCEDDREGTVIEAEEQLDNILEMRDTALKEMVDEANFQLDELSLSLFQYNRHLFDNNAIINFNYTSTIERLFNLDNTFLNWHIHGYYEDGEDLIFGFDKKKGYLKEYQKDLDNNENIDPFIYRQHNMGLEFYNANSKDYQIKQLEEKLKVFIKRKVDSVIVLGHSMGEVDHVYMEIIDKTLSPNIWEVSYYNSIGNYDNYSFTNKIRQFPFHYLIK